MNRLSDNSLLALLILETERGNQLAGGYRDVLSAVIPELSWCGFRGLQLARVGRRWEQLYSVSFSQLCPDLRSVGSDWVGL